jgi:hypothetical protein
MGITETEQAFAAALAAFQGETWRPIPSCPGYEASNLGRIRSVARVVMRRNGSPCPRKGYVLSPKRQYGYLRVTLVERKSRLVHDLVLEAFIGPRPPGADACHANGKRDDNRLANLRWDSRSANMRDAVRHGTHPTGSRTHCPRGHVLALPNLTRSMLPYRQCLACNRARARVQQARKRGASVDFVSTAAAIYAEVIA